MARRLLPSWMTPSWTYLTVFWIFFNLATPQTTTLPPNFQALYRHVDGQTSIITCPTGWQFWTTSTYGGCCIPTLFGSLSCAIPTQCHGGTVTDRFGGTRKCGSDYPDCFTMTVYESYPYAFRSWLVHDCGMNWIAHTVFRAIDSTSSTCGAASMTPSAATETIPTATGASYAGTMPTQASLASGVSGIASTSSTESTSSLHSTSPASKAWIAGAVAGPVVALVAGALGFWFGTRRKPPGTQPTVDENNRQVHHIGGGGEDPVMSGGGHGSVLKQGSLQQLHASHRPSEFSYPKWDQPSPLPSLQPQRLSGLFPAYSPPNVRDISTWAAGVTQSRSTSQYGADAPEPVHEMADQESIHEMPGSGLEK